MGSDPREVMECRLSAAVDQFSITADPTCRWSVPCGCDQRGGQRAAGP